MSSSNSTVVDDNESVVDNAKHLPWRNSNVRSLGQSPRGKYPHFLITQSGKGGRKPPCQKPAGIVPEHRQTDGRTYDNSIYRASIASRGKNFLGQERRSNKKFLSHGIFFIVRWDGCKSDHHSKHKIPRHPLRVCYASRWARTGSTVPGWNKKRYRESFEGHVLLRWQVAFT